MSDNNLITLTHQNLKGLSEHFDKDSILNGMGRGDIGFLISAPDSGKSFLCLSIAYELATAKPILGISGTKEPLKTLYWGCEDNAGATAKRILEHFSAFSPSTLQNIEECVGLYNTQDAIACSYRQLNSKVEELANQAKLRLIEATKSFDLLIIDTLREAIGSADEVEDDKLVKMALKDIAEKANVAVLVTHHLTKAAAKGQEKITNVSASGFSTTLANARIQLYLEKIANGKTHNTYLSHIKGNHLAPEDKLNKELVNWDESSLPYINTTLSDVEYDSVEEAMTIESSPENKVTPNKEPSTVYLKDRLISKSATEKAEQEKERNSVLSKEDKNEYELWLERQEQDLK